MESYSEDSTNQNKPEQSFYKRHRSGRVIAGLIIVAIGVVFLFRQLGYYFPYWMFKWEMLLIVIGVFVGIKHNFRNFSWLVLVAIGSIFLLDDIFPYSEFDDYDWPLVIIAVGLIMIFNSGKKRTDWSKWTQQNPIKVGDDFIDSTVIFGGDKKNVISKNFRGGDVTTIFGGTDINLMQADFSGRVVLDLTQIFGGTKLIVPPNWKVETKDVVAIFGGVEDKRPMISDLSTVDHSKVLVLDGTCIFGGIDIKSY